MRYELYNRHTGDSWGIFEAAGPELAIQALLDDGGVGDSGTTADDFEAIPAQQPPYAVVVVSQTSRNADGSPIVERSCGHRHRTLSGSYRCKARLTRPNADDSYRADFYRCEIRHIDGSRLTSEETDDLSHIELEAS